MTRLPLFLLLALLLALSLRAQEDIQRTCYDENGHDTRCSDGKFHGPNGEIQPDTCNNDFGNPHPCECGAATTMPPNCPPGGMKHDYQHMGPKCQSSCRDEACKCVITCDAPDDTPPKPAPKPKTRKK